MPRGYRTDTSGTNAMQPRWFREFSSRWEMGTIMNGQTADNTENLSTVIAPHLPYLRRFARALCGNQQSGDAFVASTLEAVIEDRSTIDRSLAPRVALYKLFYTIWSSLRVKGADSVDDEMRD